MTLGVAGRHLKQTVTHGDCCKESITVSCLTQRVQWASFVKITGVALGLSTEKMMQGGCLSIMGVTMRCDRSMTCGGCWEDSGYD